MVSTPVFGVVPCRHRQVVQTLLRVDASYPADLRELNNRNFALFDAKLAQRFVAFEAKLEPRFAAIEQRFVALEVKFEQRCAAVESRTLRWMFAFWATTTLTILLK